MDNAYFAALAADERLGRTDGIDGALREFNIDALVLPTSGAAGPAAIAGYPIVTGALSSSRIKLLLHPCLHECSSSWLPAG